MDDASTMGLDEAQPRAEERRTRSIGRKTHIWAAVVAVVALLSVLVLAPLASSAETVGGVRESLDSQQGTVTALAAGATALSAGLSAVPGDAMTPIANQLAELTGWFMVIIGAIILQKMLFTAAGLISFTFIVPLACVFGIAFLYSGRLVFRAIAVKFAAFGVVLFLAIPGSIALSGTLTSSYTDVAAAAHDADSGPVAQEESTPEHPADEATSPNGGLLDRVHDWLAGAVDAVGNWVEGAVNSVNAFKDEAVDALNSYMEQIALLIITTCVMPILVFLLFGWVIKMLFSMDIGVTRLGRSLQSHGAQSVRLAGRGVGRLKQRESSAVD